MNGTVKSAKVAQGLAPYYEDDLVTLYHGKWEDVLPTLDLTADLTLTDPPYNCVNRASHGLRSLDKGAADSEPVVVEDLAEALVAVTTGSIYVFCGAEQLSHFLAAFGEHDLSVLSCQPNVWTHKTDQEVDWHPTPKPAPLMEYLIRASCPPGGLVFDPFAGSGTTLLAAKNENRRAVGIEMNESYCERIVARLAQDTLFGGAA